MVPRAFLRPLFAGALLTNFLTAQPLATPQYGYEVASVKKSDPDERNVRIGPGPQGGIRTVNTSLITLISFAWDVRDYQIVDAPAWAKTQGFDVSFVPDKPEALPGPGSAMTAVETMMDRQRIRTQAVLRDRFGLEMRQETRQLPVYTLTEAKGGHKLKPATEGRGPSLNFNVDRGEILGVGVNMRLLANSLANNLKRPVVDDTGITGSYDFKLVWKLDGPGADEKAAPPAADDPHIFTAITEQLGLHLESKRGPVTVYVIEKAERPGDN
jgi:uncharacterized protein (TIGR03435 family)